MVGAYKLKDSNNAEGSEEMRNTIDPLIAAHYAFRIHIKVDYPLDSKHETAEIYHYFVSDYGTVADEYAVIQFLPDIAKDLAKQLAAFMRKGRKQ